MMTLRECQCDKAECPRCGPLVALAAEIRRDFEHATREARVPTAEIVWWRAQMRAREDAARRAARPILVTQALALAALVGLLVSLASRLTVPALSVADMALLPGGLPLPGIVIAAACCLVIAPVAVYVALAQD